MKIKEIDIVFDGPPSHESGRFIEVEDSWTRKGMSVGRWFERDDGFHVLRLKVLVSEPDEQPYKQPGQDCFPSREI